MKIAFYIHHSNLKAGGIFTYSIGVLKLIINTPEIEKVYVIHSENQKAYLEDHIGNEKVKFVEIKREGTWRKLRLSISYFLFDLYSIYKEYSQSWMLNFLKRISLRLNPYHKISKLPVQLLHVPMQFAPVYNVNKPVITTLHDVQELHLPENFSAAERLHRAINTKKAIDNSTHIIASFEHIKSDILKFFHVNADFVSVCAPAFHENWFGTTKRTDGATLRKKYELPDLFLLYPASTWIHKNHMNLILAVNELHQKGIKCSLVCTGNKTSYYEDILKPKIDELKLNEYISFLGIVSEEDLNALYKATSLVVIPTKYEAGSAPLYEAMRMEVPVICANTTSLPETMNNQDFIFDPDNVSSLAMLIESGLNDQDFIKRNLENSKNRMESFSKVNYADAFIKCYESLLQ
ncbi:MAG: glycosyltransferase family 4 protein [Bacteroidota bacterium]